MVSIGEINSRFKDFFDIWHLCKTEKFDGATLKEAIRKTFDTRRTKLSLVPLPLSKEFAEGNQSQWRQFLRKIGKDQKVKKDFIIIINDLARFFLPITAAILQNKEFKAKWFAEKGWQRQN